MQVCVYGVVVVVVGSVQRGHSGLSNNNRARRFEKREKKEESLNGSHELDATVEDTSTNIHKETHRLISIRRHTDQYP